MKYRYDCEVTPANLLKGLLMIVLISYYMIDLLFLHHDAK
jgi:hypothetical protein